MENDDMCIYKKDGQIKALGWNINSKLLQNDFPLAAHHQTGGGTASTIQNLAVPAGLIILKKMIDSNTKPSLKDIIEEPKVIGEDLYEKLLSLAGKKKRVSHDTRKNRSKRKNKTRKNK